MYVCYIIQLIGNYTFKTSQDVNLLFITQTNGVVLIN